MSFNFLTCLYCGDYLNIDRTEKKKIKINGQWHKPPAKQFCNESCIKGHHSYKFILRKWKGKIPKIDRLIEKQLLDQIERNPTKPMRKELAKLVLKRNCINTKIHQKGKNP